MQSFLHCRPVQQALPEVLHPPQMRVGARKGAQVQVALGAPPGESRLLRKRAGALQRGHGPDSRPQKASRRGGFRAAPAGVLREPRAGRPDCAIEQLLGSTAAPRGGRPPRRPTCRFFPLLLGVRSRGNRSKKCWQDLNESSRKPKQCQHNFTEVQSSQVTSIGLIGFGRLPARHENRRRF